MRVDMLRLFEVLRTMEKSGPGGKRSRGQDEKAPPPLRDEVILSTEGKRRQIFDRARDQTIERLRNVPLSLKSSPQPDATRGGITDELATKRPDAT
jgi:hypothetical protein